MLINWILGNVFSMCLLALKGMQVFFYIFMSRIVQPFGESSLEREPGKRDGGR